VSFDVAAGETLGIVGESGCGKSTTARAIVGLQRPTQGRIVFDGEEISAKSEAEFRRLRPRLQMIFQDPISSLNASRRVADILREPLSVWGSSLGIESASHRERVAKMMDAIGLDYGLHAERRPYELSGGQCQRISIGRALMLGPELLVCDEPVSSLDVSVQAQILNLLEDMKDRQHLTMVFIAHNLAVVKNVSDRVAVMYLGKLCELAEPEILQASPAHPYTAALLASVPDPDPKLQTTRVKAAVIGEPASPISPPSGCRFRTRCPQARPRCAEEEPILAAVGDGHFVACHFPLPTVASASRAPVGRGCARPSHGGELS
jgi:peptide/nickel transport system ATP-binding protein